MWRTSSVKAGVIVLVSMMCGASVWAQGEDVSMVLSIDQDSIQNIAIGSRIRLQVSSDINPDRLGVQQGEVIIGSLKSCKDGVLEILPTLPDAENIQVPMAAVHSLEVSHGKNSYALPGAAVGLGLGALVATASQTNHHSDEFLGGLSDMNENIARGTAIVVISTLLGLVIGEAAGGENWQSVFERNGGVHSRSNLVKDCQLAVGFSF